MTAAACGKAAAHRKIRSPRHLAVSHLTIYLVLGLITDDEYPRFDISSCPK